MIGTAVSRERKLVESGSRGTSASRDAAVRGVLDILTLQDVDAAGFDLKLDWPPAAGATHAEVGSVTLHLGSAVRETHLGTLDATVAGSVITVKAPPGRRLRSLAFVGLKNDAGAIGVDGRRLLISLRDAKGTFSPSYAAPNMPKPAVGPAPLTGATLNGNALSLPDVAGGPLHLAVVTGGTMADLAVLGGTTIGSVTGLAADPPFDLSLAVVGGAPVWGFPGELPAEAPDVEIDATSGVEAAMNAALAVGTALSVTLHLTASRTSTVALGRLKASGALLRAMPGPLEAALEGEPVRIAAPDPSPANETPGTVRGGLQWRYLGFRLLADRSDAASAPFVPMAGAVVGGTAVRRALPPAALDGERLGKVGLVGRALAAGKLTVTLLDAVTARLLAPPVTVDLIAAQAIRTLWIEFADMPPIAGPVAIEARAEGGPFLWMADPLPRVRLAVRDPDPGGRPLLMNGASLAAIDTVKAARRDIVWPVAGFRASWPEFASDLFLAVELFDLELRYGR